MSNGTGTRVVVYQRGGAIDAAKEKALILSFK
jgi:hypothetical protein